MSIYKSRWWLFFSIFLACFLLFLAFRNVEWKDVSLTLLNGNPFYLFLSCLLLTVTYSIRSLRWRILLLTEQCISPIRVFWITMIGYLGNSILPFRAGEVIRPIVLSHNNNISKSFTVGTIFVERCTDMLIIAVVAIFAVLSIETLPYWLDNAIGFVVCLCMLIILGLFIVSHLKYSLLERFKIAWLIGTLHQFLQGVNTLRYQSVTHFVSFGIMSILILLMDTLLCIIIAKSFGLTLSFLNALFFLAILVIVSVVPSTPGYVGIYQLTAVAVLPSFGFLESDALAFIIAFQVVAYCIILFWGFLGVWKMGISFNSVIKEKHKR